MQKHRHTQNWTKITLVHIGVSGDGSRVERTPLITKMLAKDLLPWCFNEGAITTDYIEARTDPSLENQPLEHSYSLSSCLTAQIENCNN